MSIDHPHQLDRPVFVVGAPGSGASAVAAALAASPAAAGLEGAGHPLAVVPRLMPAERGWDTSRLGIQDAKAEPLAQLQRAWDVPPDRRLVASWPDAALQVRFLHRAWPDALFVFVQRDPLEALSASLADWESGEGVVGPPLPGWSGPAWSGPLTPEWRGLAGKDLVEVVAEQWRRCTELVLADLGRLPGRSWTAASYQQLVADPARSVTGLFDAVDLTPPEVLPTLPASPPADRERIAPVLAGIAGAAQQARESLDRPGQATSAPTSLGFESSATPNFAELLRLLGSSLVVSTYQTGRVVLMREQDGALNTHFRAFEKPMGIAQKPGMLVLGTRDEVLTFRNVPGLAERVGPRHDAVFVPRTSLKTGDIRIHDLGWAGDQLWAVNTRFSCLVTFDGANSFVPRWKPPFISALHPEDRCHLNGLAMVDDEPRYVTSLGTTDTVGGWRPGKADGGVIMDIRTDDVVADGLSMPHSPRWYRDELWFLESGHGTLARLDVRTGRRTTVAELPGFTRGLAFAGRYAFVGLSQVREATTFGGIPLTGRLEDRQSGVWIVDIETGQTMGFVRFEDRVEEIFDVQLLQGIRYPELLQPDDERLVNAFVIPT